MRNILSCMFALTNDHVTLLKHYAFNEEGAFDLDNIDMNASVNMRTKGRHNVRYEHIDLAEDTLTKNMTLTTHIINDGELEEMMKADGSYFTLEMKKNLRTNKLIINVVYNGYIS